jgi:hypothetical protein
VPHSRQGLPLQVIRALPRSARPCGRAVWNRTDNHQVSLRRQLGPPRANWKDGSSSRPGSGACHWWSPRLGHQPRGRGRPASFGSSEAKAAEVPAAELGQTGRRRDGPGDSSKARLRGRGSALKGSLHTLAHARNVVSVPLPRGKRVEGRGCGQASKPLEPSGDMIRLRILKWGP